MTSRAYQMGIRGRAPKASKHAGQWIKFQDRRGNVWTVDCDSTGFAYPSIDGVQVTSTAHGYAFTIESALVKAIAVAEQFPHLCEEVEL